MKMTLSRTGIFRFVILALGIVACAALLNSAQQATAEIPANSPKAGALSKVEQRVIDDTADGKATSFIVLMTEQANVTPAYAMRDQDARGWYVFNTLKSTADRTQAALRAELDSRHIAYESYWVANLLIVTGARSVVENIAARADVKRIESNAPFKGIDDPVNMSNAVITNDNPHTVEWGVQNVNAPQVWTMGYTGQGIVIANQDTGMRWTHNAIKNHYRGWDGSTADHNYNWWDGVRTPRARAYHQSLRLCDQRPVR